MMRQITQILVSFGELTSTAQFDQCCRVLIADFKGKSKRGAFSAVAQVE